MATDLRGYSADEVLNKVLNTSNDSIQVDIVSGAEYAEDAEHTTADVGQFVLGVRNDTLGTLGDASGDYVPFQMNASGALYVEISSSGTGSGVHVDDAAFTLGSHSGMMMMGFAGTQSVDANDAGAIAMETDGSVHIHDGGNTITVDGTVTANLSATDNAVLDTIDAVLDTIKTDTGTIDSDTDAIKTATESSNTHLGNMLYGTALVVDYSGGDHSLGATYEAFYIGVGGDLSLDCVNGAVNVVFKNLASGQLLPVRATVVNQSGTDATNIVALKA